MIYRIDDCGQAKNYLSPSQYLGQTGKQAVTHVTVYQFCKTIAHYILWEFCMLETRATPNQE